MPIVASRGLEILRLIGELDDPKRRDGAILRLRSLGGRVVPHVGDEIKNLSERARHGLLEALQDLETDDSRTLKDRLKRIKSPVAPRADTRESPRAAASESEESTAIEMLRRLPHPRAGEPAAIARDRGEAHLALARQGSRLARKDLLQTLAVVGAARARLCCEAAGLIGDLEFLAPLAALAASQPEATKAIASIATRERMTARSKVMRTLDEPVRLAVAKALAR